MVLEYLISPSDDVYYNLALEEYLVRNIDFSNRKLLLVYQNSSSVVLGRNQNFYQEVFLPSFFTSQYKLARRISGGGAVVHDEGNINFAFFENYDIKRVNSYLSSTFMMTEVLNKLGVPCHLNDRNAIILANEKKVSGSAQFSSSKAILSHFTLLYDADLEMIRNLLQSNIYSIQTQASRSVSSSIDNVKNYLTLTSTEFIESTIEILGYKKLFDISSIDNEAIAKLILEKYQHKAYYLDAAANGSIYLKDLKITLEQGKIKSLESDILPTNYIGKRLYSDEISLSDPLWNRLFYG